MVLICGVGQPEPIVGDRHELREGRAIPRLDHRDRRPGTIDASLPQATDLVVEHVLRSRREPPQLAAIAPPRCRLPSADDLGRATVESFDQHPDTDITTSFRGPGALTSVWVRAEIGDDGSRFADAKGLKAYADAARSLARPARPSQSCTAASRTSVWPPPRYDGPSPPHRVSRRPTPTTTAARPPRTDTPAATYRVTYLRRRRHMPPCHGNMCIRARHILRCLYG
jgi:hypothetical protein